MNNEKTLDGALCAGVGTADAATAQPMDASGSAPAEGKKKYVPPTMQVIPLGPQRMLATSGMSGDPLYVTVFLGIDYYVGASGKQGREMVDLVALSKLTCDDLRPPAMARYSNSVKCGCGVPNHVCFGYDFSIDGPDDLDDFLANVQFDEDCSFELPRAYNTEPLVVDSSFGFTGTYRGRPVILDWKISVSNSGDDC